MKISEVLSRAADHMLVVGKCEWVSIADRANIQTSPCCAVGALEVVEPRRERRLRAIAYLCSLVRAAGMDWISVWSDATPADEVIEGLRFASFIAASEGL